MGLADSLEVFSIYGQGSSSAGYSQELSRALVKFPVVTADDASNSIQAHRTAGLIPAKDSVKFYLRLCHETQNIIYLPCLLLGKKAAALIWMNTKI